MPAKYVPIQKAMEICSVARRTIYSWIQKGYLPPEALIRTPSGNLRIDQTYLLNRANERRAKLEENLNASYPRSYDLIK